MKQKDAELLIKQRVLEALKTCKISVNKLATASDVRQTTLNDQINGNSKISAATLITLTDFRSDISAEWLLRGTGEMLVTSNQNQSNTEELLELIRRQQREIDGLYERIEELKHSK